MLDQLLTSKKEVGKLKIGIKKPLELSCEKIVQTPRAFNTTQIKSAIENISFIDIEEKILLEFPLRFTEYVLKDFFLYLHQTGLYNRQFNLWSILANITQVIFFKLQTGLIKKRELDTYMCDFFISANSPCITTIIEETIDETIYSNLNTYLRKALACKSPNRLQGIFYFTNNPKSKELLDKLTSFTDSVDLISKYESIIRGTKDTRLNVIYYEKQNEKYIFNHIYPDLSHKIELEEIKR